MNDIDNINHVGIVVRNLGSTAARYEEMGFQLTPYSPHSGAWKPGAPVQSFGSGNRCVMFANNYLEILGTEDPNKPTERLAGYLARHQGAHIVRCQIPALSQRRTRRAGRTVELQAAAGLFG
jgi:hypothetical protein